MRLTDGSFTAAEDGFSPFWAMPYQENLIDFHHLGKSRLLTNQNRAAPRARPMAEQPTLPVYSGDGSSGNPYKITNNYVSRLTSSVGEPPALTLMLVVRAVSASLTANADRWGGYGWYNQAHGAGIYCGGDGTIRFAADFGRFSQTGSITGYAPGGALSQSHHLNYIAMSVTPGVGMAGWDLTNGFTASPVSNTGSRATSADRGAGGALAVGGAAPGLAGSQDVVFAAAWNISMTLEQCYEVAPNPRLFQSVARGNTF